MTGTAAPQRRRRGVLLAAAVTLILAGIGVAGYALLRPDPTFTLIGALVLTDLAGFDSDGTHCSGNRGYDDIDEGEQIVVTDPANVTIGLGRLDSGRRVDEGCSFAFRIPNVPRGKGFYGVSLGNDRRGTVHKAEAEVIGRDVVLTLG